MWMGSRHAGIALAAAALLAIAAVACHQRTQPVESSARPRVVSLHDVTTEIVVALGAVDRLVGVAGSVELPREVESAVAGLSRTGGTESIVALRPSVVLGTKVIAERSPDLVAFLRKSGIDVFLAEPAKLDDVYTLVTEVARRTGVPAAGVALAARLRARAGIEAASKPDPMRVLVYDCCDPPFTAAGRTVLSDLIRRAGGRNVFADLDSGWTKVSWEDVLARRPQMVVIHSYHYDGQEDVEEKRRRLHRIPGLADVPVTVMPLGLSLGGIRSVDALIHLRQAIGGVRG